MMEEVFIIIKPDAISRGLISEIIECFQHLGEIEWVNGRFKSREWCQWHYAHIINNPDIANTVYLILEVFMAETLLIGFNLRGDDCIKRAREMAGTTNVVNAKPGTIRGEYGLKNYPTCYNLVHVADSPEAVRREKKLFFDRSTDYDFGIKLHRPHQS